MDNLFNEITIGDCLYILLTLVCIWLLVQIFLYLYRKYRLKRWKPKITHIFYEIKNIEERCIVSSSIMKEEGERDKYYLEYKSVDTGSIVKRKIVDLETYAKYRTHNVFIRKQSELIFYTVAPGDNMLRYRVVSSNDTKGVYKQYCENDIDKEMIEKAIAYFIKTKPTRHIYKTELDLRHFRRRLAYIETLPRVSSLIRRKRMNIDDKNKIRHDKRGEERGRESR